MAFVPAPDVVQAELLMLYDTQTIENVLQFHSNIPVTPTIMNDLGAFLVSWWNVNIKPNVPTTQQLTQVKLTDLTTQIGPVVNFVTGLPITGTNASPGLPNNCALVITKRTLLRGRSFRGRIYHGGLVEAAVTNNQVQASTTSGLVAAYSLCLAPVTAGVLWRMVVMSRVAGGVERVTADSNQVTSLDSDGVVDSQRRRLPKRGN